MSQDTYESDSTPIYDRLKKRYEHKYEKKVESEMEYQKMVESAQKDLDTMTEEQKKALIDFDINENSKSNLAQIELDKWTSQDKKAL